jgi:hypothetical protein
LADPLQQGGVAHRVEILAGDHGRSLHSRKATDPGGDETVVTGDDLERHAEPAQLRDGVESARLRWILEQQKSDEGHLLLVILVDDRVTGHVADGDAKHAVSLFTVGFEALLQEGACRGHRRADGLAIRARRSHIGADVQHVAQSALGDHRVAVRIG